MPNYKERDVEGLDKAGNLYYKHVDAMTGEKLHAKSDIAGELAYRDYIIEYLFDEIMSEGITIEMPDLIEEDIPCDVLIGHCSCGAFHKGENWNG